MHNIHIFALKLSNNLGYWGVACIRNYGVIHSYPYLTEENLKYNMGVDSTLEPRSYTKHGGYKHTKNYHGVVSKYEFEIWAYKNYCDRMAPGVESGAVSISTSDRAQSI